MAAYRRLYDSRHLQADCQEPDQLRNPSSAIEYGLYLYLFIGLPHFRPIIYLKWLSGHRVGWQCRFTRLLSVCVGRHHSAAPDMTAVTSQHNPTNIGRQCRLVCPGLETRSLTPYLARPILICLNDRTSRPVGGKPMYCR